MARGSIFPLARQFLQERAIFGVTLVQPVSTLPTQNRDEVKLWDTEVRDAQVPCRTVNIEDILGPPSPDRRLLPDLQYLQLLLADPKHLQTEIGLLIGKRLDRSHRPHTDEELPYHPVVLALFKYAARGQPGLHFCSEQHTVGDPSQVPSQDPSQDQEDIQCHIWGHSLEPSEITAKDAFSSRSRWHTEQQGRPEQDLQSVSSPNVLMSALHL
ncbi:hypothetical protein WJX79_000896 [Trebouxia sp. C0005]